MTSPLVPLPFEIVTGARLHLGLLDTCEPFGGVGAMLTHPSTRIRVRAAGRFEALGAAQDRVASVAERFASHQGLAEPPRCTIEVLERPDPHSGLGSGTQLAMATAEALCLFAGCSVDRYTLAVEIAGRGLRSAVGAHGYFEGGLIYESAADEAAVLNPIRRRLEMPNDWTVLLVRTTSRAEEVTGEIEQSHFARLPSPTRDARERLMREVEDELLPAAAAGDFERWSRAVYRYNRHSGNLFAAVQGGPYNGPAIEACIEQLRESGVRGVGQSSWGPTVFAFCESPGRAAEIRRQFHDPTKVTITQLANHGRTLLPASPRMLS